jgi:hypothetical protein
MQVRLTVIDANPSDNDSPVTLLDQKERKK